MRFFILKKKPSINVSHQSLSHLRHTFTSRFLFSGISSHLYYYDWTLDDLLGELAKQAIDAYEVGVADSGISNFMFIALHAFPH